MILQAEADRADIHSSGVTCIGSQQAVQSRENLDNGTTRISSSQFEKSLSSSVHNQSAGTLFFAITARSF